MFSSRDRNFKSLTFTKYCNLRRNSDPTARRGLFEGRAPFHSRRYIFLHVSDPIGGCRFFQKVFCAEGHDASSLVPLHSHQFTGR
jgi:hypothetical protein